MVSPRANWKGYIKFGEVSCPVALYTAASSSERIAFNTLNRKTSNRVRREFIDSETGDPVERDDQVKGYEVENGQYVVLEPDEVAAAIPESDKTLKVDAFIPCSQIDTTCFDKPYYLAPDKIGKEAFVLLRIVLWTLRYGDEVRDEDSYFEAVGDERADSDMMPLVQQLIKKQTKNWSPKMVADPVQDHLLDLIETKKKALKNRAAANRR